MTSPHRSQTLPYDLWPPTAKTLNEIGQQLHRECGLLPIRSSDIRRVLEEREVPSAAWIQPSDFAYNLMNAGFEVIAGIAVGDYPIFEQVEWGKYRYLGPNFPYTGAINWTKRGHALRKVGHWMNGERTLYEDPRQ